MLDYPITDWDPQKTYRQPVVLITFADCEFSKDDPAAYYQRLLNEPGYNEGHGQGSVADYFRDQSNGLFNVQFDIYGPVKVSEDAKVGSKDKYGDDAMKEAMSILNDSLDVDFTIYDWDGDGKVNQIIFIAAGFTGNQTSGYLWPNTSYTYLKAPGGIGIQNVSISCELWKDGSSCGIGTIIHEFSHCLALPDIYPTGGGGGFSVVDEWDLMDGGNYTNKGWCPPNYSALEKMLLGWKSPIELTSETSITGMKSVSEGGDTYIIRNSGSDNEFYLLENRQQDGWDYASPSRGLLIFHVDYDREIWSNNNVNISKDHYRYSLFNADGKDYKTWDPAENGKDYSKYTVDDWMRNKYLSTSVYPFISDSLTVDLLTDESDPAATLFKKNAEGEKLMSKPITNIRMADDGTISFDFMKDPTSVDPIRRAASSAPDAWYDLNGSRLPSAPSRPGIYIRRSPDGTTRKVIK